MKTKSIEQKLTFDATPGEVYNLIMDQEKHADFTDSGVIMSKEINGKFEIFDGYCSGYNIELVEGQKIVQAWHFEEDGWPKDHFTICTFLFEKEGDKTKLLFKQTDIPEHKVEALKDGWKDYYWKPMKEYLKKIKN